jgi:hypothetical protein
VKISNYLFLFATIVISFASCNNKKQNLYDKSEFKQIITENELNLEEYCNQESKPNRYSLYTKKIIFTEKTVYVYNIEKYNRVDSLVVFKDSVIMNNEKLLLLRKKGFDYKKKKMSIKKYQYLDRSSNIFISDSLGIIMQHGQTHPYGTVRREYNTENYRSLCNEIKNDSIFFNFEFDLKNLKMYLKLKDKNSR